MSRLFVAGAGGYLGLALCSKLVELGHKVTAFDTWWFAKEPPLACWKLHGDIREVKEFGGGADAVIDLAGLSNDAAGDIDPELTMAINVGGACNLAMRAKQAGIRHYIYSSSASIYGASEEQNLTEDSPCKPLTAYAESKVRVEDFLRKQQDDSFKPIILRNATAFGVSPRMRFDLVVNGMTRAALVDKAITIHGTGEQWRPFIHIDDVVDEFVKELDTEGGYTRNVVSMNFQINKLAHYVESMFDTVDPKWELKGHRYVMPKNAVQVAYRDQAVDHRSYHLKPTVQAHKMLGHGINDVIEAVRSGTIDVNDPTAWTGKWYKDHCDWRVKRGTI